MKCPMGRWGLVVNIVGKKCYMSLFVIYIYMRYIYYKIEIYKVNRNIIIKENKNWCLW